jgi:hypothetical protein
VESLRTDGAAYECIAFRNEPRESRSCSRPPEHQQFNDYNTVNAGSDNSELSITAMELHYFAFVRFRKAARRDGGGLQSYAVID